MEHHHYIVNGFANLEQDGNLSDYVSIEVFANTEKEALVKAQKLVSKKNYRISSVITHDDEICTHGNN